MLDFTTVDMIIIGLILFLSLKGLVNGFIKELFSFIGIIGGVAIASRMNASVGDFINTNLFPIENEPAVKLAGFVAILLVVWMISNLISSIFDNDEPGFFSRILGYGLTLMRYTAIFALIIASVQNIDLISKKLEKHAEGSQSIPMLKELGEKLLNMEVTKTTSQEKTESINLQSFKMDHNDTNQTQE